MVSAVQESEVIAENGASLCCSVFNVVSVHKEIRCYYNGFVTKHCWYSYVMGVCCV